MIKAGYICLLVIIHAAGTGLQAQDTASDLREQVRLYGQAEVTIPYPGKIGAGILTRQVSITSYRNGSLYISLSRKTVDWFLSQKYIYSIIPHTAIKGGYSASSVAEAMQWHSYPTYQQYDSIMRKFAGTYPDFCRLDTIGTTVDGRLLLALKISDNVNADEDKPQVFYSSSIHGDEIGGYVLMLRLADYLLNNHETDSLAKRLVSNLEIWINPLANPDGTYTSGNTVDYAERYNAHGEDLNRNFPDPLQQYSPEKETVEMVSFMKKHRFVISANFHAGSEVVNYPWDRWERLHADDAWFNHISRAYADTVHKYSPPDYLSFLYDGITNGYYWYQVFGGRQDYMTYERQGREVTIELDYTKMTPPSQLDSLWKYNWRSLMEYLGNAMYGVHGKVMDETTARPLKARVFIRNHDQDSSMVYSDSLTGSFTRLLMNGSWDITFSAKGYRDTTVTAVNVGEHKAVYLNVLLRSQTMNFDSLRPYIWPNPAVSKVSCYLPSSLHGQINVSIFSMAGKKEADFNTVYTPGTPFEIDLSRLSAGNYYIVFRNLTTGLRRAGKIVVLGYR